MLACATCGGRLELVARRAYSPRGTPRISTPAVLVAEQRVALVLSPPLILADEPTGNLDTVTSDAIHQLFFEVNQRHGTTVVVVTHNVNFAHSMPRVVTMKDGKIFSDEQIGKNWGDAIKVPKVEDAEPVEPSSEAG